METPPSDNFLSGSKFSNNNKTIPEIQEQDSKPRPLDSYNHYNQEFKGTSSVGFEAKNFHFSRYTVREYVVFKRLHKKKCSQLKILKFTMNIKTGNKLGLILNKSPGLQLLSISIEDDLLKSKPDLNSFKQIFSKLKSLKFFQIKSNLVHSLLTSLLIGLKRSRYLKNFDLEITNLEIKKLKGPKGFILDTLRMTYLTLTNQGRPGPYETLEITPSVYEQFPIILFKFSKRLKELSLEITHKIKGHLSRPYPDLNSITGLARSLVLYPDIKVLKIYLGEYKLLRETGLPTLFGACQNLYDLKVFHFRWSSSDIPTKFNKLQDNQIEGISTIIKRNINLEDLSLDIEGSAHISDEFMYPIAEAFTDYVLSLRKLKLRFPQNFAMSEESLIPLIASLERFDKLEDLYLSFTGKYQGYRAKIGDQFLMALGKTMKNFTNLKSFNLHLHYSENPGDKHYGSVGVRWLLHGLLYVLETMRVCCISLRMDLVSDEVMREMEDKLVVMASYGVLEELKIGLREKEWANIDSKFEGYGLKKFYFGKVQTEFGDQNFDS